MAWRGADRGRGWRRKGLLEWRHGGGRASPEGMEVEKESRWAVVGCGRPTLKFSSTPIYDFFFFQNSIFMVSFQSIIKKNAQMVNSEKFYKMKY